MMKNADAMIQEDRYRHRVEQSGKAVHQTVTEQFRMEPRKQETLMP